MRLQRAVGWVVGNTRCQPSWIADREGGVDEAIVDAASILTIKFLANVEQAALKFIASNR